MSQTANTLDRSYIRHHNVTLEPGVEVVKDVTGVYFIVSEKTGAGAEPFQIAFDEDPYFPANLGLGFTLPPGNFFSRLRFRNDTAETMEIELYTGTIVGQDMRLNIVRGRAAPMMKAETVVTGHSQTIPAMDEVDLTASTPPGPKYIRAATIVFNMDPAVDLDLVNEADEQIAPVFFRQGVNIESSAPLKVQNNTAAPVVARIAQVWYIVN